jgi:hypothetical protein
MAENDLRALSIDLLYEMEMVERVRSALELGVLTGQRSLDWLSNALLEDFTIHARQLVEFFYDTQRTKPATRSRRSSQVRKASAHDFFDADEWKWARPRPKPESLRPLTRAGGVRGRASHLRAGAALGPGEVVAVWNDLPRSDEHLPFVSGSRARGTCRA